MKKLIVFLTFVLLPTAMVAAPSVEGLDSIKPDVRDKASLQRGAQIFTNNCMGCHSAEYHRYKLVAEDLGIPEELFESNLIFTDAKIGELMKNAMPAGDAEQWFGVAPPDLTLVSRVRGPDWLYSFFRGFYQDDLRPLGVNNVIFDNVGMPHAMVRQGGLCKEPPNVGKPDEPFCEDWALEGTMDVEEFDRAMFDLTNYLVYLGEPALLERKRIGAYVLIFIAIFGVFAYLLNREYWKDIH